MSNESDLIIELSGVSKRYGFGESEYFALRDFDLSIKRGEFIMVMGPSGCGKTTLLNIIGLLDKSSSGTYALAGKNVERISARKQAKFRARQIGFIFQNFNLISSLPIIENVALPLVYSGYSKYRRLKMASDTLDHFHLQEREYYMPWQLSGGQQQRVAIARSLVVNPSIILADEPTGNLDSRSSHIVMEELREIHSRGNTIIMVTHNPALTTYATRVINMLDGEIDTDIKTVADQDLPRPGDPEKVSVRFLPKKSSASAKPASPKPPLPPKRPLSSTPAPNKAIPTQKPQSPSEKTPTQNPKTSPKKSIQIKTDNPSSTKVKTSTKPKAKSAKKSPKSSTKSKNKGKKS